MAVDRAAQPGLAETSASALRPEPPGWRRAGAATLRFVRTDWLFVLALLIGALLRLCAELGFRPILWFNDGLEYLDVALRPQAYPIRPDGYSFFLRLLYPFHSFGLVAALQHLMGLAVAVLLYALLRRWQVPRSLATLGVLPQLLNVQQIALEHLLLSDTLFTLLLVAGVVLLTWQRRFTPAVTGLAGLALALSTLTRDIGLPFVVLGGIYLLIRWQGWRPLAAYAVLAAVPLGLYAGWYHHEHGSYAFDTADGVFLYSRVAVFADCAVIKPPADLAVLCPPEPRPPMQVSSDYIWHPSPLDKLPGVPSAPVGEQLFTPQTNGPALRFAIDAMASQPLAYLRVGFRDFARSFGWSREPYPSAAVVGDYAFSRQPMQVGSGTVAVPGSTAGHDMKEYQPTNAQTRLVEPYAGMLISVQRFVFLPGTVLAAILIVGLVGLAAQWRRNERRWQILVLWVAALTLLVIPPFTAQFDYRYVMPAIPLAGAAAAMAGSGLISGFRVGRKSQHRLGRPG